MKVNKKAVDALYDEAKQEFGGYIYFDKQIVIQYLNEGGIPDIDLLRDYILANDLADDIVE